MTKITETFNRLEIFECIMTHFINECIQTCNTRFMTLIFLYYHHVSDIRRDGDGMGVLWYTSSVAVAAFTLGSGEPKPPVGDVL